MEEVLVSTFGQAAMKALLRKEFLLEMRQKYALAGVMLFILSTVFVCYLGIEKLETASIWSSLFWITGIFSAFHSLQRTFSAEGREIMLHLYQLASPRQLIWSKAIYNATLTAMLNFVSIGFFALFFGFDIFKHADIIQLAVGILLGSAGLALALTFISAIAFRSGGGTGLVAVLGFPVAIPLLIAMVRHTSHSMDGVSWESNALNLLVLVVLSGLSLVLCSVLFPYLWRD